MEEGEFDGFEEDIDVGAVAGCGGGATELLGGGFEAFLGRGEARFKARADVGRDFEAFGGQDAGDRRNRVGSRGGNRYKREKKNSGDWSQCHGRVSGRSAEAGASGWCGRRCEILSSSFDAHAAAA